MTVEQNQQEELPTTNNNRKKMLALISVLIVLAGLGWYFLYFIKTPVYSLNIVRRLDYQA